ncbi:MAG: hypothetical protein ACYC2E_10375, partial [Sulfuricella sp.]
MGKLIALTLTCPREKRISRRLKFNLMFYCLKSINYKNTQWTHGDSNLLHLPTPSLWINIEW